ncbi:hypothetical protein [Methylobacter sp. BlB1]|jgi:hypothetical protein|uniref:hypothetical protein n=1 Tax=Methylobacter sp. BlB1 TaxID=2785914 RepID=UPI00189334DA|nr:hypothetical protein [Methylobacter sp. BlB1]MBF6649176.1 hypothetical protein [Methylobacter sp. BlB1]
MKDREFAPPPALLPIVIEADDFEGAMFWLHQASLNLGIDAFGESFFNPTRNTEDAKPVNYRNRFWRI